MVNEKQLTVFVLLITFLAPAFTSEGCKISFGNRGCYSKVLKGVIVTCDGGGSHTTIPKDIPEDTIYLSLTNLRIKGLSRNDFTHLRLVECLIITNSGLSAIEPDAFTEMRKLLELEIQSSHLRDKDLEFLNYPEFTAQYVGISGSNNIRHLSANGTNFLHKIESLKLRNNGLGYVNPSFLRQLINVEVLDFSNNVLEFLDMSPLSGHRKLNHLYLFGNRFQTLSESALDTFETVKDLEFGRNPLHCNCHLKWLKEYYERTVDRTLDYDAVECVSPNRKRMMDVPVQHFTCMPPRKPIIKWELLNDAQHRVQCLSFGDPAPTLTVSLPGANPFVYQTSDDLSELNVTTPVLLVSSGVVECTAENALGSLKEFVYINPSKREDVRGSGKRFTSDKTLLLLTVYIAYCLCASTM